MRYIVGIIIISFGFLLTWKAEWLINNIGRIEWAERHLGADGGTRIFYKLLGILVIILAFMYMGGVLESILRGVFSSSINTLNQ